MNSRREQHPQLTFVICELGESLATSRRLVGEVDIGVEPVDTARRFLGLCHRVVRDIQ